MINLSIIKRYNDREITERYHTTKSNYRTIAEYHYFGVEFDYYLTKQNSQFHRKCQLSTVFVSHAFLQNVYFTFAVPQR